MSAFDPGEDGTFAILDHLPENVRDRYLQNLPKDTLLAIVQAVWRARDKTEAEEASHSDTSRPRPESPPATRSRDLTSSLTANETVLDMADPTSDAQKSDWMHTLRGEKRNITSSPTQNPVPTKKRDNETPNGIQPLTFASSPKISKRPLVASQQAEIPSLAGKDDTQSAKRVPSATCRDLPVMVRFPWPSNSIYTVSIEQLPVRVHCELLKRFEKFYTGTKTRSEAYRRLMGRIDKYADRSLCVCEQVFKDLRTKHNGKPIDSQGFTHGGVFGKAADDMCIEEKIPCAHIIKHGGGFALCFVPLPKGMRGVDWKSLTFWVQD